MGIVNGVLNLLVYHHFNLVFRKSSARFDACCIHKQYSPPLKRPLNWHAVSSGARHVIGYNSVVFEQRINQCTFTYIWLSNYWELNWFSFHLILAAQLFLLNAWKVFTVCIYGVKWVNVIVAIEIRIVFRMRIHSIKISVPVPNKHF